MSYGCLKAIILQSYFSLCLRTLYNIKRYHFHIQTIMLNVIILLSHTHVHYLISRHQFCLVFAFLSSLFIIFGDGFFQNFLYSHSYLNLLSMFIIFAIISFSNLTSIKICKICLKVKHLTFKGP